MRVLDHNVRELGLSASMFMEIQIYNDMKPVPFTVDWEKYTLKINRDLKSTISKVAIYVDLEYVNTTITNLDKLSEETNRMK